MSVKLKGEKYILNDVKFKYQNTEFKIEGSKIKNYQNKDQNAFKYFYYVSCYFFEF